MESIPCTGSAESEGAADLSAAPRWRAAPLAVSSLKLSVDVRALDQEGDAHVRPPLVEVLAAEPRGDHVDRADVAQRALRLLQRLLRGVVGRFLGASDEFDDLDYRHGSSFWSTAE